MGQVVMVGLEPKAHFSACFHIGFELLIQNFILVFNIKILYIGFELLIIFNFVVFCFL